MSFFRTALLHWPRQLLGQLLRLSSQIFSRLLLRPVLLPLLRQLIPPLDWRLLIWLLGFALLLTSTRPFWLEALDRQLFRFAASLLPTQSAPDPIDVLSLSPQEMQQLLHDPLADSATTSLVYRLMARPAPVSVVLPELPRSQLFSAERLLRDMPAHSPPHQAWQAREQLRERFLQWLRSPQVYLVQPNAAPYLNLDAHVSEATSATESSTLQELSASEIPTHPSLAVAIGAGSYRLWPLHSATSDSNMQASAAQRQPLLWRHGDVLYPGLVLALLHGSLQAATGAASIEHQGAFHWQPPQTLNHLADRRIYRLNSDGSVYPAYHASAGLTPVLNALDRSQFLQQADQNYLLLISVSGDSTPLQIASSLQSLQSGRYFHSPWWAGLLEKGLIAALMLYALWLMPRFGNGVRILVSVLLLVVLLTTQLGYQITQLRWLPLGIVMQFLILATLLIMLWRRQQQPIEQLQRHHDAMAVQWSQQLVQQHQLDQALAALEPCKTSNEVLDLLYEIGGQHERKRRPAAAAAVYRQLLQRKRRYKDVAKRLKQLEQPQASTQLILAPNLSKTVVIGDAHGQPQFGRYQVESELGRGAMGVVYLGFDPKISRRVAIKTLDYSRYEGDELNAVKARFFREAEAAGRLRHPNIVSVYDVGEDHDLAYIAMDYIEGQPLSDFTSRKAQLPMTEVFSIIADVADALHYAHRESIVHRDIKPANILYHRDSRKVTVTDFGIARILSDQSTQTGEILGSPLYMSPEQILGKKVDKASDIFSLGVTLFQLLASELPFKGDNIAELSRQILQGKPADIRDLCPSLPAGARRIINKALQKDPKDRYRDAAEMANALRNIR